MANIQIGFFTYFFLSDRSVSTLSPIAKLANQGFWGKIFFQGHYGFGRSLRAQVHVSALAFSKDGFCRFFRLQKGTIIQWYCLCNIAVL